MLAWQWGGTAASGPRGLWVILSPRAPLIACSAQSLRGNQRAAWAALKDMGLSAHRRPRTLSVSSVWVPGSPFSTAPPEHLCPAAQPLRLWLCPFTCVREQHVPRGVCRHAFLWVSGFSNQNAVSNALAPSVPAHQSRTPFQEVPLTVEGWQVGATRMAGAVCENAVWPLRAPRRRPAASMRLPQPARRAGCSRRAALSLALHFLGGVGLFALHWLVRAMGLSPASSLGECPLPVLTREKGTSCSGQGEKAKVTLRGVRRLRIYIAVVCRSRNEMLSWKRGPRPPKRQA